MWKKFIGLFTILAFLLFDWACVIHTTSKVPVGSVAGKNVQILGVMKTSGDYVAFPPQHPAGIFGDRIVGSLEGNITVPLSKVRGYSKREDGTIYELTTKDGITQKNILGRILNGMIVITPLNPSTVSIPLSEVEMVSIRKVDAAGTFLASVGMTGLVLVGIMGLIALLKESCPFIYAYDGTDFAFDAEPYGGATSPGLKRTEWVRLEHLKAVQGEYRLRLRNEVDETQHTDELELVVVDHEPGLQVVPDERGAFHTFVDPQPPLSARDQNGRDLMPYVQANDWIFWQSRVDAKDPNKKEDLRDELVFEFPKPAGANQAKLLFNGCNTLWASSMLKRFLELYGTSVADYHRAVDAQGPFYWALMNWHQREELCFLKVWAETPGGWTLLGTVVGGGPFVSEDKAYVLDLSGVPGEVLRLKLTPPSGFWMINYLAMDYAADKTVQVTELEPTRAKDSRGRDIRALLARTDDIYYDAPSFGDSADITYLAPAQRPGRARSVFCKASGYYEIHLTATGQPRWDILSKVREEPGYPVRYSLREYKKWRDEVRASLSQK